VFNNIKKAIRFFLLLYPKYVTHKEYIVQDSSALNERPVEFGFVFKCLTRIYPKKVLDIGTGMTALPHLIRNCGFEVTATDNIKDYWPSGMFNRHYHVINDDITNTSLNQKYNLITCVSVLEHIEKFEEAVRNMFKLLDSKGFLILTFPYTEADYVHNVYDLEGSTCGQNATYITQSFSRKNIDKWLSDNNGTLLSQEYWRIWEGDFWTVGNKIIPPVKVDRNELHQLSCLLIQKC